MCIEDSFGYNENACCVEISVDSRVRLLREPSLSPRWFGNASFLIFCGDAYFLSTTCCLVYSLL